MQSTQTPGGLLIATNILTALRKLKIAALWNRLNARQVTEDALAEERNLLNTLTNSLPDAIYFKDTESRFIRVNLAQARQFGLSDPAQAIGKTDFDFFTEEHARPAYEDEQAIIRSGLPLVGKEEKETWPNGRTEWVSTTKMPLRDQAGRIVGTFGISRKVTERKQAEDALAAERNLLRSLIDNAPDYIYVKDAQGRFITANPALARLIGVAAPDELVGKTDYDIFPQELAAKYYTEEQTLFQSGQLLLDHEETTADTAGRERWVSTTKVPLRDAQGKILGLVGMGRDITERKRAEEAARQANEKLKVYVDELERRNREVVLITEMGDLLQTSLTIEEAYAVITQYAPRLFPDESGALFVYSASRNLLDAIAVWGDSLAGEREFAPDECWALRRGKVHRIDDPRSGLICQHVERRVETPSGGGVSPFSGRYMCVPMMAQGETLGILHLQSGSHPEQLSELLERLAVNVSEHVALALANLKLREILRSQSIRDPLTGLFNRRYMEESLERELHRAHRKDSTVGIVMIDIDRFKRFNDTFGHDAGDTLLRELGTFLHSHVRGEDIACRCGGEEFTLILPETSLEVARQRADDIREGVKHLSVEHRHQPLGAITLSLGVATFPDHGKTGEAVLRVADAALYRAKRAGRDRVQVAEATNSS